jgi:hypothetical protein
MWFPVKCYEEGIKKIPNPKKTDKNPPKMITKTKQVRFLEDTAVFWSGVGTIYLSLSKVFNCIPLYMEQATFNNWGGVGGLAANVLNKQLQTREGYSRLWVGGSVASSVHKPTCYDMLH